MFGVGFEQQMYTMHKTSIHSQFIDKAISVCRVLREAVIYNEYALEPVMLRSQRTCEQSLLKSMEDLIASHSYAGIIPTAYRALLSLTFVH